MAAVRGPFHRPLLGLRRADTEQACREWGLDWWDDPMNDRVGNILLTRLMGADSRIVEDGFDIGIRESWERALADVKAKGGKPYAIVEAKATRDEDAPKFMRKINNTRKPSITSTLGVNGITDPSELIEPFFGDTQIFIYPGYQYKVIDALVTNFHLPESTLIMLVSAFAGYQHTMNAYKAAVEQKYRFFSYGDAMFITYNPQALNERVGE